MVPYGDVGALLGSIYRWVVLYTVHVYEQMWICIGALEIKLWLSFKMALI